MNRDHAVARAGHPVLGSLVAFVLLALLAVTVVAQGGGTLFGDRDLLEWSLAHRPDLAVTLARLVTHTGTGFVPYALVALAGFLLGRTARQRIQAAAACLACLVTAQAVRFSVMALLSRPRPDVAHWATDAGHWSFPSGHTTTSAVTAGLLVLAVWIRAPRGRRLIAAAVGCWAVLVGLSRVYLGVHWFSDVVGGWLFAVWWLGLVAYGVARLAPDAWADVLRGDGNVPRGVLSPGIPGPGPAAEFTRGKVEIASESDCGAPPPSAALPGVDCHVRAAEADRIALPPERDVSQR
ncbi:phosphatase PAP2 family protein [Streptomyces sp. NBC_00576]|uniref:phosphatase PAP2 family protein n=1 Tax=Streptomyces sp. NBC_00576 TaxID=2903665 RepID=UPI002E814B61|nr:phosphatase PAP2 family protein [Streptomyces sp. NBC_00576]WUB76709.1 phosphatase PAP2 family protein [Streptomyces sp. NBC_00576]